MRRAGIGSLRQRIMLQAPSRSATEGGAADETWEDVAQIFASVMPRTGRELFRGDGVAGERSHDIRFRYRPGVTPEMRLVLGARIFEILSVIDEDERRRWLVCGCREDLA